MDENLLERLKRLINVELEPEDRRRLFEGAVEAKAPCVDIKVSIKGAFQRRLFREVAALYKFEVFRKPRQRQETLMVHGSKELFDDEFWPRFQALSHKLHDELVKTLNDFLSRELPNRELCEACEKAEPKQESAMSEDDEMKVVSRLEELGFGSGAVLSIPMRVDPKSGAVQALGADDPVPVRSGSSMTTAVLPPISELYRGDGRVEGDITQDPHYLPFLASIERTALEYCQISGRIVSDEEFHRLYKQLKQKPDSRDRNPMFSYLQAAVRAYMAITPVSKQELRAVVGRLLRSAKTFRMSKRSTNYYDHALSSLDELG